MITGDPMINKKKNTKKDGVHRKTTAHFVHFQQYSYKSNAAWIPGWKYDICGHCLSDRGYAVYS